MTKPLMDTLANATLDDIADHIDAMLSAGDMTASGKGCGPQKSNAVRAKARYYRQKAIYDAAKAKFETAKDALWAAERTGDPATINFAKELLKQAKAEKKAAQGPYQTARDTLGEAEVALAECEAMGDMH